MDLTVEEGSRLKVVYGSSQGFHAIDVDSGEVYDIYLPKHVSVINVFMQFITLVKVYDIYLPKHVGIINVSKFYAVDKILVKVKVKYLPKHWSLFSNSNVSWKTYELYQSVVTKHTFYTTW